MNETLDTLGEGRVAGREVAELVGLGREAVVVEEHGRRGRRGDTHRWARLPVRRHHEDGRRLGRASVGGQAAFERKPKDQCPSNQCRKTKRHKRVGAVMMLLLLRA